MKIYIRNLCASFKNFLALNVLAEHMNETCSGIVLGEGLEVVKIVMADFP
jgi:hypothetical protein